MEFPPGFYFYLSFAFSFFLSSIRNPSIYPSFFFFFFSSSSYYYYYYYCSRSNSSIYSTLFYSTIFPYPSDGFQEPLQIYVFPRWICREKQ